MQQAFWGIDAQAKNTSFDDWLNTVDSWWKAQSGNSPQSVNALYNKLLSSSRFFIHFTEPFTSSIGAENATDPSKILVKYLELFIEAMEKDETASETIKGFWKLPLDMWQQQLHALSNFPDSFLHFATLNGAEEANPEFTLAFKNYLNTLEAYQAAYIAMSLQAASALMKRLDSQNSPTPLSAQAICSLWTDIFEEHYELFIRDQAYPRLYADVINHWMILIQQTEILITPWLKAINMPTRDDLNAFKAQQQNSKKADKA